MSSSRSVAVVHYAELLEAFEFVSFGTPFEHSAYIDPDTGRIFCVSSEMELEDEVPDDLETSDRYIAIPHKNDLNLGRALALSFVTEQVPNDYETVARFFRRKGAYRLFKDFLDSRNLLERWYAFETRATGDALRRWCQENEIALIEGPPSA